MTERVKLHSLYVSGFKSFAYSPLREIEKDGKKGFDYQGKRVEFGDLTVLLGSNGSGKTNLLSLLAMLMAMRADRLKDYVEGQGGGEALLHFGSKTTRHVEVRLDVTADAGLQVYELWIYEKPPDGLRVSIGGPRTVDGSSIEPDPSLDGPGYPPNRLPLIRNYDFQDTSPSARIRKSGYIEEGTELSAQGHNLAAFLYTLQIKHPAHYDRIRRTIQHVCPQFDDFALTPRPLDPTSILLNWRAQDHREYVLGPHQVSDGTLRFMALTTLLLQPTAMLPATIVIDEPELGLHPSAISALAGMVKAASLHSQVILATQSPTLVDHFDLGQIRAVQMEDGSSRFLDLDTSALEHWLDRYTLGEMWQKNLFRAGPEHG